MEFKRNPVFNLWKENNTRISIPISGRSMFPLIDDRDLVTIEETSLSDIKKGDIIAFLNKGRFIVHRVIRTKSNGEGVFFCQKGDSSPFYTWINGNEILGRIVEINSCSREINLKRFPWRFNNRCLALLGLFWVSIFRNTKEKKIITSRQNKIIALSRVHRKVFLFIKALSYTLTNLLLATTS